MTRPGSKMIILSHFLANFVKKWLKWSLLDFKPLLTQSGAGMCVIKGDNPLRAPLRRAPGGASIGALGRSLRSLRASDRWLPDDQSERFKGSRDWVFLIRIWGGSQGLRRSLRFFRNFRKILFFEFFRKIEDSRFFEMTRTGLFWDRMPQGYKRPGWLGSRGALRYSSRIRNMTD